jgi:hypothetical protein
MINYLTLAVALMLSVVAAYYSIVGLTIIFAAAVIPVAIMGSVLEAAKVVSASWLYHNWKTAPSTIKYYLTVAVVVLSFITSMGIFGFLAKAHIDQTLSSSDYTVEVKQLENEIAQENRVVANAQRSLDQLDKIAEGADVQKASAIRNGQSRERGQLDKIIKTANASIVELNKQLTPLKKQSLKAEAEVGPIKYVAEMLYDESDSNILEKAVRWVIVIIVLVFDPLAIILLVAANHSLKPIKEDVLRKPLPATGRKTEKEKTGQEEPLIKKKKKGTIEIDKNSIVKLT